MAAVAPNWLGDAVMCLPALRFLASSPGVSLSVLSGPYVARVFLNQPGVDDLWVDRPGGRPARIRARTRALRAAGCDAAVVFPPSFSSALPPLLAGVPKRIGFRADGRRIALTHAPATPSRDVHLTRAYLGLAMAAIESAGLDAGAPAATARLHVSEGERDSIRRRLGPFAREGYVVVVPGAAFGPAKSWPDERYRALCALLARETHVVLAGSAGDRAVCDRVAGGEPGVHSVAGDTSLGELFALMEGARVVVANDSGAPHAAAALDVPCIVLFGSTSPAWTAPAGDHVRVLQHKVHCNPCYRRTCPTQLECFNGIEVEEVIAAVRDALRAPDRKSVPPGQPVG
jgi:heptosyltransferase-2